jgi:hypothetical protein
VRRFGARGGSAIKPSASPLSLAPGARVSLVARVDIERMTRDDVGLALEWAAGEGWNPGLRDADAFFAADPEGFFVLKIDRRPVASVSAIRYGQHFGFLGLYITSPEMRGSGYGLAVWRAAREHLAGRVVGLDAVVEQETTYARDGFVSDYRTTRHVLESTNRAPRPRRMVDARELPLETLLTYERELFPAERARFVAAWLAMPGAMSRAVIDGDQLLGWALRRPCADGYKIGPLFADDPEIAEDLLRVLAADAAGPLYLDIPDPNRAGHVLAARHDMKPVFTTIRMYDGSPPRLDHDRIFGVTTLELG